MMQMVMNSIEEDILVSRMKYVRTLLDDLVEAAESRVLTKDELFEKVKVVEKGLKQTRQGF
jgi:hypothetical protein